MAEGDPREPSTDGGEGGSASSSAMRTALRTLHVWQIQAVRDVLLVAAIVLLVWVGYTLRSVTVPLLVALLLAYLFEPLVVRLTAHPKLNRPIVVGGLLCTVVLAIGVLVMLIVPIIVGETSRLMRDYRDGRYHEGLIQVAEYVPDEYREAYLDFLDMIDVAERADGDVERFVVPGADEASPADDPEASEDAAGPDESADESDAFRDPPEPAPPETDALDDAGALTAWDEERLRALIREEMSGQVYATPDEDLLGVGPGPPTWLAIARGGAAAVFSMLGTVIAITMLLFLIPFYFFFFSVWYPSIVQFGRQLLPEANRPHIESLLAKMDRAVSGFVRGRIVISFMMGLMFAIGWYIVGVPYAVALGFVVGIFCAVPFLGIIGIPLAVGLLFFDQIGLPTDERMAWWAIILWPTVVFLVVQAIESYAITPVIAGKATNLDPVTIIVVVIAGGSVMGVYGMLLAIPVAACGKIYITDVLLPRVREWTQGRASDPLPFGRGD